MFWFLTAALFGALHLPRVQAPVRPAVDLVAGPYAVGYRTIDYWDRSRATAPARDFAGRDRAGVRSLPMQFSVWYPARSGGAPMRIGEYKALSRRWLTLGATTEADVSTAGTTIRSSASFVLGIDLPTRVADSIAVSTTLAVRDAIPAAGRFPLVVGGLGGAGNLARFAEYLASYGYVVATVPAIGTGTLQVTQPQVALETHTRNMEMVYGMAQALPFVDTTRSALIGVNFDGLAALTHQMRNMSALAVVSLDGWELKSSASILRASPYFDPVRVRVPYLAFSQANAPNPGLAFNDSVVRGFKYSERLAYVVRGMDHGALIDDKTIYPSVDAAQRAGYDFVWRTTRTFLDAHVRNDSGARAWLAQPLSRRGYAADLLETVVQASALPAVPTSEELEQIAMTGQVAEVRAIHLRARANDPELRLFTPNVLNLYAFRFAQRGERATAIAFQELAVEAFPRSMAAANNLGTTLRDAGQMDRAIAQFERALTLIDSDDEIPAADRAPSRAAIEQKIRELKARKGTS